MALPTQFFTVESLGTLAGATGITAIISNGIQRAFNFNPKWLALAIAEVVCMLGAAAAGAHDIPTYFVAFANGFLVYLAAAGGTSLGAHASGGGTAARALKRGFWSPWF